MKGWFAPRSVWWFNLCPATYWWPLLCGKVWVWRAERRERRERSSS